MLMKLPSIHLFNTEHLILVNLITVENVKSLVLFRRGVSNGFERLTKRDVQNRGMVLSPRAVVHSTNCITMEPSIQPY